VYEERNLERIITALNNYMKRNGELRKKKIEMLQNKENKNI